MRILNIGSINIDHVYAVDHFVRPGETLASGRYGMFAGGKGFNQSIALARAGAPVHHAGRVGREAGWLLERLDREGVGRALVKETETPTGHAIIQVVPSGENAIVLHGGANRELGSADIAEAVASCAAGDYLLLQNETSGVGEAIRLGAERGLRVVFNPAPMSEAVPAYPLGRVSLFVLNETEAEGLTGAADPAEALREMRKRFPQAATVLTLGAEGACYSDGRVELRQPAERVKAVDTTAAGDTFIGYFLAEFMASGDAAKALTLGCRAAAVCVTRPGAADSIPFHRELR